MTVRIKTHPLAADLRRVSQAIRQLYTTDFTIDEAVALLDRQPSPTLAMNDFETATRKSAEIQRLQARLAKLMEQDDAPLLIPKTVDEMVAETQNMRELINEINHKAVELHKTVERLVYGH